MDDTRHMALIAPIPPALASVNPLRWLTVFGPGAIIASLTIGTGELIFSSRGGAIFGYRVLFLFLVIVVLKWVLVFSTARHMVLSGVHPFRRWMELELPNCPRGWFPAILCLFAVVCIPIWVSFHASVLGNLISGITGTRHWFDGAIDHLWGAGVLAVVGGLALAGGYRLLERAQLLIVATLLLAVTVAVIIFQPDWWEMFLGAFMPARLQYPDWLLRSSEYSEIAARPVWIEATLYVGVIGGAGFDYLAYTSFLREKHWGMAREASSVEVSLDQLSDDDQSRVKQWIRAPLADCTLSFLVVLLFSAAFVASGATVLAPAHQIPSDQNFLEHQAQFVTRLSPWLYPLYVVGTGLAMLGTLYGTLEVAPTVIRESLLATDFERAHRAVRHCRVFALLWCIVGALAILAICFGYQRITGAAKPPSMTAILIPANLFTGVLSCGLICLLNPWMDRRFLPPVFRMSRRLAVANLVAGVFFVLLGLKGYWDQGGILAFGWLAGSVLAGGLLAKVVSVVGR